MNKIIECIPNVSEGQNPENINALSQAIKSVAGVDLLNIDPGFDANRTVFTFAGEPQAVIESAYLLVKEASRLIDMRQHKGIHSRIGAVDVCPFVPIANVSMAECISLADNFASRVSKDFDIPVYLYEHSAKTQERKNLATIRAGEYELLKEKMQQPEWKPDYGNFFNPRFGAMVTGAREFLIAYNVNLATQDKLIADKIAKTIRESGYIKKDATGKTARIKGMLKDVKAIGWYVKEYGFSQVSTNIISYHSTPFHRVYEECKKQAAIYNTEVIGSELIGLIPKEAILMAGEFYRNQKGHCETCSEKELIDFSVQHMELSHIKPFNPEERIIEYILANKHLHK